MIAGLSLLAFLLLSAVYHAIATVREARDNSPPGKLIDVGGHRLHIHTSGEGSPVVVLDSGIGGSSLDWAWVQPEIAKMSRVCSYDRAGYGWSEFGSARRTSRQVVDELRVLLTEASLEGPYVLVGHSYGGLGVRLFASIYPDAVAAVVLVDAVPEDLFSYLPAPIRLAQLLVLMACRLAASLGLLRLAALAGVIRLSRMLSRWPVAVRPSARAILLRSELCRAVYGELKGFRESAVQLAAAGTLGDLPLIVLSADKPPRSLSMVRDLEQVWRQRQTELPGLSSNSTHIVAENSRHTIQYYQPDAVVDAIRRALDMSRHESRSE